MLAPMFYLGYMLSELRRRKGRTLLTALGLGVGVGLVVTVSALSKGVDDAQQKVLKPLTGVGTDMSVTRPLKFGQNGPQIPGGLSAAERKQLQKENGPRRFDLANQAKPGEKFTRTDFMSAAQLSFPASQVAKIAQLKGVDAAAGSLTLNAVTVKGTVPKNGFKRPQQGPPGSQPQGGQTAGRAPFDVDSLSVTGVDESKPELAAVKGFHAGSAREAVLNESYARRNRLKTGDSISLGGKPFKVIGLASSPLGGQASDAYVKLAQLQQLSDRKGRVNSLQVRADSTDDVGAVEKAIKATMEGASVTTASDLADRVGGSLKDAKNLSGKLGTALTIVALVAAFLIATLLTLSSVTKRIRELGTLKALGWPGRTVVRQVTGESVLQGALGGILGAAIGIGGAALVTAFAPTLEATVAAPQRAGNTSPPTPGGPSGGVVFGLGRAADAITSGTEKIALTAPVDVGLILLAIGLALLGGLIAGSAGGLRASRLRPADALRHID
jgi:putative ABC transport system permease protein